MGFDVHDYEYIRNHLDEYQYTMAMVKQEVADIMPKDLDIPAYVYDRGIEVAFYKKLIDSGEMSVPARCHECPFHSISFGPTGILFDNCDLHIDILPGNLFFAESRTRPKWCSL